MAASVVCSGNFSYIQEHSATSATFRNIEGHLGKLRHIQHYWGILCHIKTYSEIRVTLYNRDIFNTLAYLELEASSKVCQKCKMIRHLQSPGIVRAVCLNIFKDICEYSGILMHIHPNSGIIVFAKRSILNVWQCPEYTSVSMTAQSFVQWPYVLYQTH